MAPPSALYRVQTDVSGNNTPCFRSFFGSGTLVVLVRLHQPFGCISTIMVRRADKGQTFTRWQFYRPMGSQARTWKKTLQNVIGKGRVPIRFLEISRHRVELEWPEAVTSCSAKRLIQASQGRRSRLQAVRGAVRTGRWGGVCESGD